jgi:hypothetical protein
MAALPLKHPCGSHLCKRGVRGDFLDRTAVQERRIGNVASTFVWSAAAMAADVAQMATEAKGAETQAPRKEGGPAGSDDRPMINPWLLFEPLFAALAPLGSGVATGNAATQAPTPGLPRGGHFPVFPVGATRA